MSNAFTAALDAIKAIFGDVAYISLSQASKFLRRDSRSLLADKNFPVKKSRGRYIVSVYALAEYLS